MKKTDPHDALSAAGLKLCGPFDILGMSRIYSSMARNLIDFV